MKPRIAIDMDEVVADVYPKFEELYERDVGKAIRKEEYWGKKLYEVPGGHHIRKYLHDKGFFADLPVMEGSQEVIRELQKNYEIYFVTAAMEFRNSFEDKYDWAQRHFPNIHWRNLVFCGDKSMIKADYMIDDHVHNLETFAGKGLLFTATHNIAETRFERVDNWQQVRTFFQRERNHANGT